MEKGLENVVSEVKAFFVYNCTHFCIGAATGIKKTNPDSPCNSFPPFPFSFFYFYFII